MLQRVQLAVASIFFLRKSNSILSTAGLHVLIEKFISKFPSHTSVWENTCIIHTGNKCAGPLPDTYSVPSCIIHESAHVTYQSRFMTIQEILPFMWSIKVLTAGLTRESYLRSAGTSSTLISPI